MQLTNKEIRDLIKKNNLKPKTPIGHITTELFRDTLTIRDFYPFGRNGSEFLKIFEKKGIASKIKHKVLTHLHKRYPNAKKIWIKSPSKRYREYLEKIGLKEAAMKKSIEINKFKNAVKKKVRKINSARRLK
jgi:predicted DNA-binding protein (UPF0278 family)